MAFTDHIAALPNHAAQAEAKGFLPPILRAQGHLMLVLVQVADENATPDEDELLTELRDAKTHWDTADWHEQLSAPAAEAITGYSAALTSAIEEFPSWESKDRIKNVRDLASRAASIAVVLDRELVGLAASDAGYNL